MRSHVLALIWWPHALQDYQESGKDKTLYFTTALQNVIFLSFLVLKVTFIDLSTKDTFYCDLALGPSLNLQPWQSVKQISV